MIEWVFETILIIAYMHKMAALGFAVWIILMIVQYFKKSNAVDYWVRLIILSIPISYLEVSCEAGSHIFKWYNFCVLGLAITLLCKTITKIERKSFAIIFGALIFQLFINLFNSNLYTVFIELMQEYITVITIWLFWNYKREQYRLKDTKDRLESQCVRWTDMYLMIASTSSISVIYQYILYTFFNVSVGKITVFPSRTVFDITFTGYSVLSVLLGAGMIISLSKILKGYQIYKHVACLLVTAVGCVINSSRSGLFAALLVMVIMVAFSKKKSKFVIMILVIAVMVVSLNMLLTSRNAQGIYSLLDDNGRINLATSGGSLIFSNLKNLFFGLGIDASATGAVAAQHNMFLEFLELNGLILFIPFFAAVIYIIICTRKKENRYLLWHILISHQFFSSFFATTFLPVVVILTLSSHAEDKNKFNF